MLLFFLNLKLIIIFIVANKLDDFLIDTLHHPLWTQILGQYVWVGHYVVIYGEMCSIK